MAQAATVILDQVPAAEMECALALSLQHMLWQSTIVSMCRMALSWRQRSEMWCRRLRCPGRRRLRLASSARWLYLCNTLLSLRGLALAHHGERVLTCAGWCRAGGCAQRCSADGCGALGAGACG